MTRQQSGEMVTKYFDCFQLARVNAELSKGNLTKHEKLEKAERNDGNTANPEKVAEDKFLAMAFLECANHVRLKTLWYSLRKNHLTGQIITQRHLLIHTTSSVITYHQLRIPYPMMEVEISEAQIYTSPRKKVNDQKREVK